MKFVRSLCLFVSLGAILADAQSFQHIVVVTQENRTPDNLFQGLCGPGRTLCPVPYDLQNFGINKAGQQVPLVPTPLGINYDPDHSHNGFVAMCDLDPTTNQCRMDGLPTTGCKIGQLGQCWFAFVNPNDVGPYLTLAQQYGWANYMFQTNQGPSFPAHQFLFGGTSAPSAADDAAGIFASENMSGTAKTAGCTAEAGTTVQLIDPTGENNKIYPCFEHQTMADVLPPVVTWRYYAPSAGSIWTAPNAIQHICQSSGPGGECTGPDWTGNVDLSPADVLKDISACNLRSVSWVVPTGANSDHASVNDGGGPSWVASIVNAIGNSAACDSNGGYWQDTAIFITWDDWGGWYDHERPTILAQPEGDYQYGFRVPLVVVSAYTAAGYINNERHDFGSVLRFIERNFGVPVGALNFADARATNDLSGFFDLNLAPRPFQSISAPKDASFFLNDKRIMTDPDDQ